MEEEEKASKVAKLAGEEAKMYNLALERSEAERRGDGRDDQQDKGGIEGDGRDVGDRACSGRIQGGK